MEYQASQYEMSLDQRNKEPTSETPLVQGCNSAPSTDKHGDTNSISPYESSAAMVGPALPPRPSRQLKADDVFDIQLRDLQRALDTEVKKNKQYEGLLGQSRKKVQELNQVLSHSTAKVEESKGLLNKSHEREDKLNIALDQTTAEAEEYKALWKQSAADLNSHLVNDRGFKPFDDRFFIEKVMLLRRNIRDFAYQYYDDWPADIKHYSNPISEMADMLDLDPNCMCRDFNPSSIVRGYIWGFLDNHVFGRFIWAKNPPAMRELLDSLKPSKESSPANHKEKVRQIDLWKARTSVLLQDPLNPHGGSKRKESQQESFNELTNNLIGLLPPNAKTKDLSEQVSSIWDDAVRLDMDMNTQASGLQLYYRHHERKPMAFDNTKMEVEQERDGSPSSDIVTCILAPALRRRGEADGTRLAERAYLLKMLVLCQARDERTQGQKQEEREHAHPGIIRAAASNLRSRFMNY
ncbi:hypothetical protein FVEG_17261 [Fusarium verticillioides 7600]|uniref:Uncharacterized protein n=1 Tax=Gibberella moniliformis (strain M3125 / FGSC 7600) TaxID=334819 RepID=W7N1X4_GIBM7|nr:hypothetical protein FVEG_17261 [Fusarium verticillioides 7600]EWG54155.1 hypothetical protein FVEG_17261 [Fusarium verticillioides 7600]